MNMKGRLQNVAVLFLVLTVQQLSIRVSSVPEGLEKLFIETIDYTPDLFILYFKSGFKCTKNDVSQWCGSLNAAYRSDAQGRRICSCTCEGAFRTFLPQEQVCVDPTGARKFGGCSGYFEDWLSNSDLLYRPVNLSVDTALDFKEGNADYCYIVSGHYFDFEGFETKWKSIRHQRFSFDNRGSNIKFQWKAANAGKLSGRIIRLNVTCNYSSSTGPDTKCMLFKALGSVTYYSSTRSVVQSTAVAHSPLSSAPSMTSLPAQPSTSSSSSSLLPLTSESLSLPFTASSTGILSVFPSTHSPSRLTKTAPVLSTSRTELQSSLPFHSKEASSQVFGTRIPNPIISTVIPHPVEPSKSSLSTEAASSAGVIDGPGNKKARTSGNGNGTVIGAAVGGAVVFAIFVIMIIIFCKRRKLREVKEKPTKLQVKNPVYGGADIPMSSATENPVTTSMDQDSQPTYQDLVTDNGKISGAAIYSSADDNDYDNYSAYQSLDKKVPGSPVYQGLTKGQLNTGKPTPKSKPSVTRPPGERSDDTAEPLYNVLEQPDTEQGTMPEKASEDSDEHTQEPVYNVLDGSDSEETYEAGESLYNVLEEPESMQDQQQPLHNVLESSDAEKSSRQGAQGSCGLSNEPLYNVLEGPDSDEANKNGVGHDGPNESTSADGHDNPTYEQSLDFEPNKSGVGCAAPSGSSSSDAHDNPAYEQSFDFGPNKSGVGCAAPSGSSSSDAHGNPAYEQSLDFDVPYASVQKPGSQRESVYEPLRGPNDHSLYEPIK